MIRNLLHKSGPAIVVALSLLPLVFWLPFSDFSNFSRTMMSIGQLAGLVGFSLYALNIILSARLRIVEDLFSGLNRVYIFHHIIGAASFIFLLYHPLGISVSYLAISLQAAAALLWPTLENLPVLFGILSLLLTVLLLVLTLYVRLEYDFWKKTHQFLGLAFFLGSLHVVLIGSTLDVSPALRAYLYLLIFLSLASFTYRTLLGRVFIRRSRFTVVGTRSLSGDTLEVTLKNESGKPFNYHPGQFVFVEPVGRGIPRQSHPFSVSSSPDPDKLEFVSKSVGDFTETLKLLSVGNQVMVEGPYGRFGYDFSRADRQIWVAGGIGITPFVSLARSLGGTRSFAVDLFYMVKDNSEAVYSQELENIARANPDFRFHLHSSKDHGRLTAASIAAAVPQYRQADVFVCGPPVMMSSMRRQFRTLQIRNSHIHSEEFALS